jgi:prepilin-type N-terminal cleavage/methylation domain-containing protein
VALIFMKRITFIKFIYKGFSLIEMLIAIALFAIVAVITTQSLAASLKNSQKSEALSRARENADYAVSTMDRLLRNAQKITSCSSTVLTYNDEYGGLTTLSCESMSGQGYIASGSANIRLTSTEVDVNENCTGTVFNCPGVPAGVPQTVIITVKVSDANLTGAEGAVVTSQTKINLRNYDLD